MSSEPGACPLSGRENAESEFNCRDRLSGSSAPFRLLSSSGVHAMFTSSFILCAIDPIPLLLLAGAWIGLFAAFIFLVCLIAEIRSEK